MNTVLLALRLVLAVVFATAGTGKLLDRPGSREALADFGVTEALQAPGAVALPLAELATAVALLIRPSAVWGAVAALVLLLAFIAGISAALAGGRAPECHCFGQIHSEPAGPSTLIRNGVLGAVSVVVIAAGPGPSINGWVAARSAAQLGLAAVVVAVLTAASLALARWSRTRALARAEERERRPAGLELGAKAPDFAVPDLDGRRVTLRDLTARGRPVILVFTHPGCGPCQMMFPDLARWQATLAEQLSICAVSQGEREDNRNAHAEHQMEDILIEPRSKVYDAYAIKGTPSAVVVSPDGRIGSVTASGSIAIEELIRQTTRRAQRGSQVDARSISAAAASVASTRSPSYT